MFTCLQDKNIRRSYKKIESINPDELQFGIFDNVENMIKTTIESSKKMGKTRSTLRKLFHGTGINDSANSDEIIKLLNAAKTEIEKQLIGCLGLTTQFERLRLKSHVKDYNNLVLKCIKRGWVLGNNQLVSMINFDKLKEKARSTPTVFNVGINMIPYKEKSIECDEKGKRKKKDIGAKANIKKIITDVDKKISNLIKTKKKDKEKRYADIGVQKDAFVQKALALREATNVFFANGKNMPEFGKLSEQLDSAIKKINPDGQSTTAAAIKEPMLKELKECLPETWKSEGTFQDIVTTNLKNIKGTIDNAFKAYAVGVGDKDPFAEIGALVRSKFRGEKTYGIDKDFFDNFKFDNQVKWTDERHAVAQGKADSGKLGSTVALLRDNIRDIRNLCAGLHRVSETAGTCATAIGRYKRSLKTQFTALRNGAASCMRKAVNKLKEFRRDFKNNIYDSGSSNRESSSSVVNFRSTLFTVINSYSNVCSKIREGFRDSVDAKGALQQLQQNVSGLKIYENTKYDAPKSDDIEKAINELSDKVGKYYEECLNEAVGVFRQFADSYNESKTRLDNEKWYKIPIVLALSAISIVLRYYAPEIGMLVGGKLGTLLDND